MRNKRILVTGSSGFIGKSLCRMLNEKGYENLTVFRSKDHDLTKEKDVDRLFKEKGPFDWVIHLGATIGGIGFFKENPGRSYYDNVMMNTLILEKSRLNGVKKFLGVGSILSYPAETEIPLKEENLWKGFPDKHTSSYGLSKRMMLAQGQVYREQYGFKSIHLIMTNLYGAGYDFKIKEPHVIPSMIKKFSNAKEENREEITMWGTGKATREFLYIDDAAEAIILAMEKYNKPEPLNIGSGEEISIKQLAEKISMITGFKGKIIWDAAKPEGKLRSSVNMNRAREEIRFVAKTTLDEGLKKTVAWFEECNL